MDITIVSAVSFEIVETIEKLTSNDHKVHSYCFGIGSLTAAENNHILADFCMGKDVIYIGTCGAFDHFSDPELFLIDQVSWLPYGERIGECYRIANSNPTIILNKNLPALDQKLPKKHALCSSEISMNPLLHEDMPPKHYVENVELYSISETLMRVSKSFTPLLTTTNLICREAHSQWLNNHKKAAQLTSEALNKIL